MEDSIHHRQLRQNLIKAISLKGITDEKVLEAIGRVPRHLFLSDPGKIKEAYEDVPLPIGSGQTISQPFTVAYQTQLLELKPKDKVLEIGTGSGYQSAILFELGAEVYSLERRKELYTKTRTRLSQLGYGSIKLFLRDGALGLEEAAPFDKIIVTAGAAVIPEALKNQLKTGGQMVIPVGRHTQKMVKVLKTAPGEISMQEFDDFRFVPFLGGTEEE